VKEFRELPSTSFNSSLEIYGNSCCKGYFYDDPDSLTAARLGTPLQGASCSHQTYQISSALVVTELQSSQLLKSAQTAKGEPLSEFSEMKISMKVFEDGMKSSV
jgi:hypothetical protein